MNLDFSALSKSLPKIKNFNPLDELAQETGTESQQMRRLQYKVDEQRRQLEQLMKVLSDSRQEVKSTENRYRKPVSDDPITFQLLEEIKNLKRQIQKLEDGPRASQPPFIPPFIPQQQQYSVPPYFMNYPMYAPPPAFQQYNGNPYYYNPYEIAHNQPLEHLQQQKKKQEKQEIKQAILELLQNGEIQRSKQQKHRQIIKKKTKTKQQNSNESDEEDDFPNESISENRSSNRTRQESQSQNLSHKKPNRLIKPLQTIHQSQNKTLQQPPKVKVTPERLKVLKNKFRAITKWVIFCFRKHWDKLEQDQMNIYNEKIGTFDSEFLFETAIKNFFVEGEKKKLFKTSWIVTENKDIPNRANQLILVCQTLLTTVITTMKSAKFSDAHQQYIQSFTKNGGYLFTGHSAFVAQRLEIKFNKTLIFASDDQRKMAFLEYAYISTFLMEFIMGTSHWTRLMQNYKEPLKLLMSYLQYLYIDRFKTLHVISPNIRFNKECFFCKFDSQNFNDIKQIINSENPNYQITTKSAILGLYDETVLQPVIQQGNHQTCKNVFNDLCELVFSKIQV